jgi:phage-related protein
MLRSVIFGSVRAIAIYAFPQPGKDHIGYALYMAQNGGKHRDAKILSGFGGAGVLEVIKDHRADTFAPSTRCIKQRLGEAEEIAKGSGHA